MNPRAASCLNVYFGAVPNRVATVVIKIAARAIFGPTGIKIARADDDLYLLRRNTRFPVVLSGEILR